MIFVCRKVNTLAMGLGSTAWGRGGLLICLTGCTAAFVDCSVGALQ